MDWSQAFDVGTFYKRAWRAALTGAGLPSGRGGVRFHDLRHTYASLCASASIPAYRLAEYMGHSSEVVTRTIYTHLFAEDSTADMDRLTRPAPTPSTGTVVPIRREAR